MFNDILLKKKDRDKEKKKEQPKNVQNGATLPPKICQVH